MPQVSILLPFYNAGSTLDRAIDSISSQTFEDWELLLVNNASVDHGPALAEKWERADHRIKVIHSPQKGIAHALNHGLSCATSSLIARMDADDWSHPMRLAKQLAFLGQHPEVGVVSCQTTFKSNTQKSEGYEYFVNWQNDILSAEQHLVNRFKESPVAHPTVMFRRELVELYGSYGTDAIPEDYELWLRWMEEGVHFAKIPEALLTWTDSPSRLSRIHTNYSEEAFFKVKGQYLARWMKEHVGAEKKVVACGTSKECRQRAKRLMDEGVRIDYLTDVVPKRPMGFDFLPYEQINAPDEFFVLNLIGQRGVRKEIEIYFNSKGFVSDSNFMSLV